MRKLQRQAGARENAINYTLRRGETEHRVDTDLWLCALDLALVQGWAPPESDTDEAPDASGYARPSGLSIADDAARRLGESLDAELDTVSDEQQPLSNHAFGEEHTEELIARRMEGERLADEEAMAARELLSGPPKNDARVLAGFLKEGGFDVE